MTIAVSDFEKVCRCCLETVVSLQSIFDCSLVMMFRDIVRIEMDESDGLPQKICIRCTLKLSSAFNYKETTIRNYKILCDVLKNSKDSKELHASEERNIETKQINMDNNNKSATKQKTAIGYEVTLEKDIQSPIENDEGLMYDDTFGAVLMDSVKNCDNDSSVSYLDQACSEEGSFLEKKNVETRVETECFEECDKMTIEGNTKQINDNMSRKQTHLCSHCGKIFKWKTSLYKHLRLQTKGFECDVHTKGAELDSLSQPEQKNIHKCSTCDATFKSSRVRNNHEKTHSATRPTYNCAHAQCLATFYHKHSLRRHCQRKHSMKLEEHTCEHCNKTFHSEKSLKNHLRVHKVENVDNDSLQTVSNGNNILSRGLNIISMEYLCMVCKKKCDSQSEFELHECGQQSHHL